MVSFSESRFLVEWVLASYSRECQRFHIQKVSWKARPSRAKECGCEGLLEENLLWGVWEQGMGEKEEISSFATLVGAPSCNISVAEDEYGRNVRTVSLRKGRTRFAHIKDLSAGEGTVGMEVFPEEMAWD